MEKYKFTADHIIQASQHDHLTGLPRMSYFFELAEKGKDLIEEQGRQVVMLFLNLNGMKYYNSRFGFARGDQLLIGFSQLLVQIFGDDNCCHISGDQFAAYTQEEGLEERLQLLFTETQSLNDGNSLSVRVGIYPKRMDAVPISTAMDRAKHAAETLRDTYISHYAFFNESMLNEMELRQYILTNLDRAIEEKWIQVYHQPLVRAVNSWICDEEALARWIDPVKGMLSPADFIPVLESARMIYKLDLYVLDEVLESLKYMRSIGYPLVSQSINLSRADFDSCDMVEEFRKRVEASGISPSLITVEITESVIGSDFLYMKEQVERFQSLGFPVWMDDFGSGYSSLDVLQSIKFDLIKFDMIFMQRLDEGTNGKIILTEMMKLATALGVDTACEGVETEEQVRFLQEIGCSKLQGYYFQKPAPDQVRLERFREGFKVGYENPEESRYFETIGRVNLYDLSFLASSDDDAFQNLFDTLPVGILEVKDEDVQVVRSNPAYRSFLDRFFGTDLFRKTVTLERRTKGPGSGFIRQVTECCISGSRVFFDEEMPNGAVIHAFCRKIGYNEVSGKSAVAVLVLSITEADGGATYASIARALASDYYLLYYVNLDSGKYIKYSSPVGGDQIAVEHHGDQFFEDCRRDVSCRIYEEDREAFQENLSKEHVVKMLDEHGTYTATYRLADEGEPVYAIIKMTRMAGGNHIIIGASIADSLVKQNMQRDIRQKDQDSYARIEALDGGYLSLYTVDPETGQYRKYSSTDLYESLGLSAEGEDFFGQAVAEMEKAVYPEDREGYREQLTREHVFRALKTDGIFQHHYRLIINGEPRQVSIKIARVREYDGEKLIAGVRMWKERK